MLLIGDLMQYLDRFYPRGRRCHFIHASVVVRSASDNAIQGDPNVCGPILKLSLFQIIATHSFIMSFVCFCAGKNVNIINMKISEKVIPVCYLKHVIIPRQLYCAIVMELAQTFWLVYDTNWHLLDNFLMASALIDRDQWNPRTTGGGGEVLPIWPIWGHDTGQGMVRSPFPFLRGWVWFLASLS